jgi:hypothetical protein
MLWYIVFGIILHLIILTPAGAEPPNSAIPAQSLMESIRGLAGLTFCEESVPLDLPEVRERMEKEMLLSLANRAQVILWLKRASRYMPHIEKMLAQNGLPEDIKYVAIVESALRPHVGSHKGAVGYWQFIRTTGQNYGLTVNGKIDERRNFFASTLAAISYFKDLYADFGSWTLAAAAYNMGEKGLQAAIEAQHTNNYYHLYLPLETQRYLFKILSVKQILSNPRQYGFDLKETDLYKPIEFDLVTLTTEQTLPLRLIADASDTYLKKIKELNPEIRGFSLDAGIHVLRIPQGMGGDFYTRFDPIRDEWIAQNTEKIYVVQKGDHLTAIATRFNIPLQSLLTWNQLNWRKPIHPGDRLIIYQHDSAALSKSTP